MVHTAKVSFESESKSDTKLVESVNEVYFSDRNPSPTGLYKKWGRNGSLN